MAKNNQTVKLYTKDTVVATSSKGNQEKWYNAENNSWYKLDKVGFEALAEAVASEILINYSNIESELGYEIVPYSIETVDVHRKERIACASPNFLSSGQSIQTAYHILKRVMGSEYQQILAEESTIQKRLVLIVDTVEKSTGLTNFGQYLTLLFEVDALIANEDRHLNNFGLLRNAETLEWIGFAPIYDSGSSLGYDKRVSQIRQQADITCKPFKKSHAEQIKLVSDFSWIDFDKLSDVSTMIMEILSDESVQDFINEQRAMAIAETVRKRIETLQGIAIAHSPIEDTTDGDVEKDIAEDYTPKMNM